jgi:hypothetical protein
VYSGESQETFWRNIMPPSSGLKTKSSKKLALLAACFVLISCLAYSLTVKIEVTCYSKMLVDFQWTVEHYIPEDKILHNDWYEYFNPYEYIHSITFQKAVMVIVTTVRVSDLAVWKIF